EALQRAGAVDVGHHHHGLRLHPEALEPLSQQELRHALDHRATERGLGAEVVERILGAGLQERNGEIGDVSLAPRLPWIVGAEGGRLREEDPPALGKSRQQELLSRAEVAPADFRQDEKVHYEAALRCSRMASAWTSWKDMCAPGCQ